MSLDGLVSANGGISFLRGNLRRQGPRRTACTVFLLVTKANILELFLELLLITYNSGKNGQLMPVIFRAKIIVRGTNTATKKVEAQKVETLFTIKIHSIFSLYC